MIQTGEGEMTFIAQILANRPAYLAHKEERVRIHKALDSI